MSKHPYEDAYACYPDGCGHRVLIELPETPFDPALRQNNVAEVSCKVCKKKFYRYALSIPEPICYDCRKAKDRIDAKKYREKKRKERGVQSVRVGEKTASQFNSGRI